MIKKTFKISGMHCPSCALLIEGELEDRGAKASCNYHQEKVEVEYDPKLLSEAEIKAAVVKAGYRLVEQKRQ